MRQLLATLTAVALTASVLGLTACGRRAERSANVPDVPVYPGATLRLVDNAPDLDPTEYYTVTGASASEVRAWYGEQMPRRGWTATGDPGSDFVVYRTMQGCYGFVATFALPEGGVDLQISQQRPGTQCLPFATPTATPRDR